MYIEIREPVKVNKAFREQIFKSVESSLDTTLTERGKNIIKKDINRYLLVYNNDTTKVLNYFKNYKTNLRKLYLNYTEEAFQNVINNLK